jgi:FkbM family methyltransferase
MISDTDLIKIGKIFGLEKSKLVKKLFVKYMKRGIGNCHGVYQKEVQGSKMLLNFDDPLYVRHLFLNGIHSYSVTSCFYNEVKPGMVVFDIGANIGYLTFLAAKICGDTGAVIAFEPGNQNCELMKKSLALNEYKNVEIINKAISNQSKTGKLFISPYGSVVNTIIEGDKECATTDIEIISLDDFIRMRKIRPDFIKIDVQGAEYLVLEGMKDLLENNYPLKMVIEFSPRSRQEKMNNFAHHWNRIEELGFRAYYIKEPRKPIDAKSFKIYENEIKKQIPSIKNLGFSRYDEVDVLFVRE